MNRKRDEALGLNDDSEDTHSQSGISSNNLKKLQKALVTGQNEQSHSLLDSELLTDEKSQSQLTSNVDSVYSFYNQAPSQNDQNEVDGQKVHNEMDLKQIMYELNASVFTSPQSEKKRSKAGTVSKKVTPMSGNKGPVEIFTFLQKKSLNNKARCKLSKKSTVFQNPLIKKYDLGDNSQLNSEITNVGINLNENSSSCFAMPQQNSENDNNRQNNNYLIGGNNSSLKNFNGVYISRDVVAKPKPKPKKKAQGKDLRYKLKDLELACNMTFEDFFCGTKPVILPQSSQPETEESVEDKINQSEVDNAMPLQDQGDKIMKRQKLNSLHESKKFVMKDKLSSQCGFTVSNIYFNSVSFPLYQQSQIMNVKSQTSSSRLNKLGSSLVSQLKQYILNNIKIEDLILQNNKEDAEMKEPIEVKHYMVMDIEIRNGICSLISKIFDDSEQYVKLLINPMNYFKIKIFQGSLISVLQIYKELLIDDTRDLVDGERFIETKITRLLVVKDFKVNNDNVKNVPNDSTLIYKVDQGDEGVQSKDTDAEEEEEDDVIKVNKSDEQKVSNNIKGSGFVQKMRKLKKNAEKEKVDEDVNDDIEMKVDDKENE